MDVMKELAKPELIWFIIGVSLLFIEFSMPGLVVFFFAVGAWIVTIICFFVDISINTQLLIFLVTSIASLLLLRQRLKTVFSGYSSPRKDVSTDMDDFTGKTATVTREIRHNKKGRVEFHGTNWDAEAEETIEVGATVEIVGKESITLKVKLMN